MVLYPKNEKSTGKSPISLDKSTKKYYSLYSNLDIRALSSETFPNGNGSSVRYPNFLYGITEKTDTASVSPPVFKGEPAAGPEHIDTLNSFLSTETRHNMIRRQRFDPAGADSLGTERQISPNCGRIFLDMAGKRWYNWQTPEKMGKTLPQRQYDKQKENNKRKAKTKKQNIPLQRFDPL